MNYLDLNLQIQCNRRKIIPKFNILCLWIQTIIDDFYNNTSVSIGLQIVRKNKIQILNKMYRQHDYVTNILAFRYNDIFKPMYIILGDIIICNDILLKESKTFNKPIFQYYAYIIIHGILHLLNFNHKTILERAYMRFLENKYLKKIGLLEFVF